jgi:hypothetical protein
MFWITTLHPVFLFLLTFIVVYLIAAFAMKLSQQIVSTTMWAPVQTPLMQLTGVFLALLLAFLATNVWKDLADAKSAVEHETNAIERASFLSSKLSPGDRARLLKNLEAYLRRVADHEWETMKSGKEDIQARQLMFAILAQIDSIDASSEQMDKLTVAIDDIAVYRSNRIAGSLDLVSPVTWMIVLLQAGLILLTVALVHHENQRSQFISLAIISSVIASVIFLILFYDQPFANAASGSRNSYYLLIRKIAAITQAGKM